MLTRAAVVAAGALVFAVLGAWTAGTAYAEAVGCRSTTNAAQLAGFGNWDGTQGSIQVCWDVAYTSGAWEYEYTVSTFSGTSTENRRLSHLWMEVTEGAAASDFVLTGAAIDDGPKTHSGGPAEDGFPGTMYGIKIGGNDATTFTFTIRTGRAPVWGDWYAKDGSGTWAYNAGFNLADPTSNALLAVENDHIVRPNGMDKPAPAPGAASLVGLGLAAAAVHRRRRRSGRPTARCGR
jgi:MYXO-CTERM domain-containing protein